MKPVLSVAEMAAVDEAAPEPVEELIERAGGVVARVALQMLGGSYGKRVVVVAGKGNNGADGRAAARRLNEHGVRAHVVEAADAPRVLPRVDLVIDAAYGTGFRGTWKPPDVGNTPVLAVDVPSGVDALTDGDLVAIDAACADLKLITGGSGLALGIPDNFRRAGMLAHSETGQLPSIGGHAAVLAGSCSAATQAQVAHMQRRHDSFVLDPLALRVLEGDFLEGDTISVDAGSGDTLTFTKRETVRA